MSDFKPKGHLAMIAANAMWGLMSPAAKVVLTAGTVTPLLLTDMRIAGAAILFWLPHCSHHTKRFRPETCSVLREPHALAYCSIRDVSYSVWACPRRAKHP